MLQCPCEFTTLSCTSNCQITSVSRDIFRNKSSFSNFCLCSGTTRGILSSDGYVICGLRNFRVLPRKSSELSQCVSDFLEISYLSWRNFRFAALKTNLCSTKKETWQVIVNTMHVEVTQLQRWLAEIDATTILARVAIRL